MNTTKSQLKAGWQFDHFDQEYKDYEFIPSFKFDHFDQEYEVGMTLHLKKDSLYLDYYYESLYGKRENISSFDLVLVKEAINEMQTSLNEDGNSYSLFSRVFKDIEAHKEKINAYEVSEAKAVLIEFLDAIYKTIKDKHRSQLKAGWQFDHFDQEYKDYEIFPLTEFDDFNNEYELGMSLYIKKDDLSLTYYYGSLYGKEWNISTFDLNLVEKSINEMKSSLNEEGISVDTYSLFSRVFKDIDAHKEKINAYEVSEARSVLIEFLDAIYDHIKESK